MEYIIYSAFSYSAKYPDTNAVYAAQVDHGQISVQSLLDDIKRSGNALEANKPLMEGLERTLKKHNPKQGDQVNIHVYQEFLIDGLNGLMHAWQNNKWIKFYDLQPVAYRNCWMYLKGLVDNDVKLIGVKEQSGHKIIEDLKSQAQVRKNEIVAAYEGRLSSVP